LRKRKNGIIDGIGDLLGYIYKQWLPKSDYQNDNALDFELYDACFTHNLADSIMEPWVSVKEKK